ncbi:hypothetical protein Ddye_017174 [Dipteronia dyeriana]|uniref:Transmembrane protein n=1 Tax=Dipteronia dyeriana TaxID=168575 RepID=A0AAD9U860_9ROSI|nr:hypothetical protein Ddye_017174 [Dipteronia dyeriana]
MENKKIISPLSFTSLILIIIVTYSSLTLTLFSKPYFFSHLYNNNNNNNITTRFTNSIQLSLFFSPSLFSSSSSPLFDPGLPVLVSSAFQVFFFRVPDKVNKSRFDLCV